MTKRSILVAALFGLVSLPAMAQYSQPVRDVENPARFPLRARQTVTVEEGLVGSLGISIGPAVAADRRWVIEHVSVDCGTSATSEPARVLFSTHEKTSGGGTTAHTYPIAIGKTLVDGFFLKARSIGKLTERIYHDGGSAPSISVYLTAVAPVGGISCAVEVSGYTVSMP